MSSKKRGMELSPKGIVIYFILFGGTLFLLLDILTDYLIQPNGTVLFYRIFKYSVFLLITALLIYLLVKFYSSQKSKGGMYNENLISILDSIDEGFVVLNHDLNFTFVNKTASILFNLPREECIDKNLTDIFRSAKDFNLEQIFSDAIKTKQPRELEIFHPATQKWFANRIYPWAGGLSIIFQETTKQKKLEAERHRLLSMIDTTSDIFGTASPDGTITYINRAGIELIGFNPLENKSKNKISDIHPKWASDIIYNIGFPAAAEKDIWKGETAILDANGKEIPVSQVISSHKTNDGKLEYFVTTIRDISDIKQKEEALKESEEKFYKAFQASPVAIVITRASDAKIIDVNDNFINASGYSRDETIGKTTVDLNLWKNISDREMYLDHFSKKGKVPKFEFEFQNRKGETRQCTITGEIIRIGKELCYLNVIEDITEQKNIEKELRISRDQLRNYTAKLQSIREEERSYISREIHDELGQILTALKMDLSLMDEMISQETRLNQRNELSLKIESMSTLLDSAIQSMRKIITELRPVILDTMGLSAAIEWQADEFQQRTGITCFYAPPQDPIPLPRDIEISLFRFLQESLTNIMRHSKATRATITLKSDGGNLFLMIHDNGKGISKEDLEQKKTFGITGMRERIELLGGKFKIQGTPGKGTLVTAEIPLTV